MFEHEVNEELDNFKKLPIYTKALEINYLLDKIASFINEPIAINLENTELFMAKSYIDDIVSNAYIIVPKLQEQKLLICMI